MKVDQVKKELERERGRNRFHLIVGKPFVGEVDAREMDKYAFGKVRSFQEYLNFSGVTFEEGKNDTDTCRQLHWVPYSDPTEVEKIVGGGWKMNPSKATTTPKPHDLNGPEDPFEPQGVDKHAEAGGGGEGEVWAAKMNAAPKDDAAAPTPKSAEAEEAGMGGLLFYFFMFGGVLYVVMANEGVAWKVGNLWHSKKPHESRA